MVGKAKMRRYGDTTVVVVFSPAGQEMAAHNNIVMPMHGLSRLIGQNTKEAT